MSLVRDARTCLLLQAEAWLVHFDLHQHEASSAHQTIDAGVKCRPREQGDNRQHLPDDCGRQVRAYHPPTVLRVDPELTGRRDTEEDAGDLAVFNSVHELLHEQTIRRLAGAGT